MIQRLFQPQIFILCKNIMVLMLFSNSKTYSLFVFLLKGKLKETQGEKKYQKENSRRTQGEKGENYCFQLPYIFVKIKKIVFLIFKKWSKNWKILFLLLSPWVLLLFSLLLWIYFDNADFKKIESEFALLW